MNTITLSMPPTLNASYRARSDGKGQYKTADAKAWQNEAKWLLNKFKPLAGDVYLTMIIYYKFPRDIDAGLKVTLDTLEGHAYVNDKQIVSLTVTKVKEAKNPRIELFWNEM